MKTRKLLALVLALTLVLSVLVTGCGSQAKAPAPAAAPATQAASAAPAATPAAPAPAAAEKKKITITYWGAGANSADPIDQIYQKTTDNFNKENKINAEAELQYIASATYYTKLPAMIAANTAPDLFSVHASGKLKQYVDAGKVQPLNEYLDRDTNWKGSFVDGVFKLLSWDNKIYSIPWYSSAVPLFYNKEIFAKYNLQAPKTYEEMKNVISVLTKNKVTPFAFGAKDAWTPALFMEIVANRIGGDKPFNDLMDGKGNWSDPSYVKAGKVMQELVKMNAFPSDFLGLGADNMQAMFKNGEAAMYVMGSWGVAQVYADDSKVKDKIGATKFPTIDGGTGDPDVWLGQTSVNLSMSNTCKNKDAAIEYLKYWTADPAEKFLGEVCGQIPTTKVKLDTTKVSVLGMEVNNLMANSKGMFIFYDVGLGAKIGDEFNNTVQAICAGKPVEEQLKKLQTFTESNR